MSLSKQSSYYWQRRKVIKHVIKNWLIWALHKPRLSHGKPGDTTVIFVRLNARARIFNLGYILRQHEGIRTILLTQVFDYKFHHEAFDEIYPFFNYNDLKNKVTKLARRYDILAVIGSAQPAMQTRVLLEMPRSWPVLIDQYDSYWSKYYFSGENLGHIKRDHAAYTFEEVTEEKYCYQKADGIIVRSGDLVVLINEHGIKTPYLLLEDGCNTHFFQSMMPQNGPKGTEWSIVYPGITAPMSADSQMEGDIQLVPLGKSFANEKIHFHIYPSPHHNYQYPEYKAEMSRNPFFHIHESVGFSEIHQEIVKYDFGWHANQYTKHEHFSDVIGQHALGIKFFTFLESGLPIIVNKVLARGERMVREMNTGIVVDNDAPKGLREVIEKKNVAELIQGVDRARNELSVNNKSKELLDFIVDVRSRYDHTHQSKG